MFDHDSPLKPTTTQQNLRNESLKSSPRCRGLASCVWPCPWYLGQCPNLVGKWRWCTVHRTQSDHELECSKSYHISMAFFEFRAFDSQENQAPLDSLGSFGSSNQGKSLCKGLFGGPLLRFLPWAPARDARITAERSATTSREDCANTTSEVFEVSKSSTTWDFCLTTFQGFLSFHLGAPNPSNPRHSILGQNPLQLEFGTQEFGAR